MQIKTNFIEPPMPLAPAFVLALSVVIGVVVTLGIWLLIDAAQLKAARGELSERLVHWQTKRKEISTPVLPPAASLHDMKRRVADINRLNDTRGASTLQLLQRLERLLPDTVYITQFTQRAHDGEIQLVAESSEATALTTFLLHLQNDPGFSQALLTRQAQRTVQGQRRVQFELRLKQ